MSDKKVEVYTQQAAVNWLSPPQLLQTGVEAVIAATIGGFADSREVQGALFPIGTQPPLALPHKEETWIDYVADTGDSWDATCSVAWCVSRDALHVGEDDLPRGHLLVLGGDQVYPTPAKNAYRTRFIDPFCAAFPEGMVAKQDAPLLLAMPGNHDWYDGLRGFGSLFCRYRPIGSWRTQQSTSYFSVKLPHGWWLWGLDLQLASEIDRPQLDYFKAQATLLGPGDKVILCTPEPSWIGESERLEDLRKAEARASSPLKFVLMEDIELQTSRFRSLREVESLVGKQNAHLAAVIAGDHHHYVRYAPSTDASQPSDAPQRITCGGGGAYVLGTHALPEKLDFFAKSKEQQTYQLGASYPTKSESRKLRDLALPLPARNYSFTALLAAVYMLYLWVLQNASKHPLAELGNRTLIDYMATVQPTFWDLFKPILQLVHTSPASALFTAAIIFALMKFTCSGAKKRVSATIGGLVHACAHLWLAMLLLWIMVAIKPWLVIPPDWFLASLLGKISPADYSILIGIALGGLLGGLLFGIWLVISNRLFGWHFEEVFSCQSIVDYKSFLRMKITPQGLTIYPLKIAKVCRKWRVGDDIEVRLKTGNRYKLEIGAQAKERFVPDDAIKVELIEWPITIPDPGKA